MTLSQLTNRLQDLCHNGHSLQDVEIGFLKDGETFFCGIDDITVGVTGRIIISGEVKKESPIEKIAKVLKSIPDVKQGETKKIECPLCGGKNNHAKHMSVTKAKINAHLWVKCADCGFMMGA